MLDEDFEATPEGHIRAATTLDRETRDTYELTVIAMDQGNPVLMNTTNVHITVTDINDNTPIIIPFLSTAEVKEVAIYKSILASQLIYVWT